MTIEEMQNWVQEHIFIFTVNKAPTRQEAEIIFQIANELDTTQTHRMTSCGRCFANAKRVIIREFELGPKGIQ